MSYIVHSSDNRGQADHGWLQARHSFSFASWQDPRYMGVSSLRVINEDRVAARRGFGMHSHDNMEILTCVLSGKLTHKDSMGNIGHIEAGDWQLMSAGTGVTHSEMNDGDVPVHLLQIWLFPNIQNPAPSYQELSLKVQDQPNQWHLIVAPVDQQPADFNGMVIRQNARILSSYLQEGQSLTMPAEKKTSYLHVVSGAVRIENGKDSKILSNGDAVIFDHADPLSSVIADTDAQLIWFDLP